MNNGIGTPYAGALERNSAAAATMDSGKPSQDRDRQCYRLIEDIDGEIAKLSDSVHEHGDVISPALIHLPSGENGPCPADQEVRSDLSQWMKNIVYKIIDIRRNIESMTARCTL